MANEKRLIDANALADKVSAIHFYITGLRHGKTLLNKYLGDYRCEVLRILSEAPTVDAVEVVFCDECENHGNCYPETIFRLARIEKPFCCVGKRKTNTNCGAKMDGDGNG